MIAVKFLLCLVAWPPFLIFLIVCVPFLAIFWLYRLFVTVFIKSLLRRDLKQALFGLDLVYSLEKYWKGTREAIAIVHVINGSLDVNEVKQRLVDVISYKRRINPQEVLNYDRLTKLHPYKWMGFVFWKFASAPFDINKHVRVVHLDANVDHIDVNPLLTEWLRSPFAEDLPVWDVLVIPDFKNENGQQRSLLGFRVHHVASDGYSMVDFAARLYDEPHKHDTQVERINVFVDVFLQLFWAPLTVGSLINTYVFQTIAAMSIWKLKCIRQKRESDLAQKLTLTTTHFPLTELKSLRQHLTQSSDKPVTFATLMWFLVAGTLRRLHHNGEFDASKANMKTGNGKLKFNVGYGTPLRAPHPLRSFLNHWATNNYSVSFGDEPQDERLAQMVKNFYWRKISRITEMDHWIHVVATNIIPNSFLSMITNAIRPSVIGLTNLPGSQKLVHLCGAQVDEIYELTGLLYQRYSFTLGCYSYNGRLSAALLTDDETLNKAAAEKLLKIYFRQEINELTTKHLNP